MNKGEKVMEREAVLDYFICDGNIRSTSEMYLFNKMNEKAVYEVIKIIDGIPLYFNEHLSRMKKSLMVFNVDLKKKEEEILKEIVKLVELNKCKFINVKLVYNFSEEGKNSFLIYFIKSEYPQDEKYKSGVHTILFQGKRKNPNIKTISSSFKERVKKSREEQKAYEALLVDEEGYITEGSRSNIFFIKDSVILTPPGGKVLLGVTRNRVLKICKKLNLQVKEEIIKVKDLKDIQAGFITGTTVDVLPIFSIDNLQLTSANNNIMQNIIHAYNKEMKDYIKDLKEYLETKKIIGTKD